MNFDVMCNCGSPLDGSHDHHSCGPFIDLEELAGYHREHEPECPFCYELMVDCLCDPARFEEEP